MPDGTLVRQIPAATEPTRPEIGEVGWRVMGAGAQKCRVSRYTPAGLDAFVHNHTRGGWAKKPMKIATCDLFLTQDEARKEYRLRAADVRAGIRTFISSRWEEPT